jgi:hypothetical protein
MGKLSTIISHLHLSLPYMIELRCLSYGLQRRENFKDQKEVKRESLKAKC